MEKIKRLFATAASKNGSYSVGLTAMAVAAVLLFNLAAGQLPQQAKQIDISDNRLYEISEEMCIRDRSSISIARFRSKSS